MSASRPFITLGILGSYARSDIQYNVNTYIGQSFQDFELIFCFDRLQCIPVSDIIDTLNAHSFAAENRVKILENADNEGLVCNAMRIVEEARGKYIFFLSLEDAFYDTEALARMQSAVQNRPHDIVSFRTLIHHNGSWITYPAAPDTDNTVSICYPKDSLGDWKKFRTEGRTDFVFFQRELLQQVLKSGHALHYEDINTIVHRCAQEETALEKYYNSADDWKLQVSTILSSSDLSHEKAEPELLSRTHIQKLLRLLYTPDLQARDLFDEYYFVYRQASRCAWPMPSGTAQYLKILQSVYRELTAPRTNRMKLFSLRQRLKVLKKKKKKKLLFLAHEYSVWPSFQSVYEEAVRSKAFQVRLVYVPFFHAYSQTDHARELSHYEKAGYPVISGEAYDLAAECPDVVFYVKPYDSVPERYQVKELRKIVDTIVYIPYGMEIGDTRECLTYQCYGNMQYYADYILAYSPFYLKKMQEYTYTKGSNYLAIGHPRIDLLRKKLPEAEDYIDLVRKKADTRRIVLWNTHFTISEGDNWGSFLIYGETILDYFKKNSDLFLLWRPHPLFYQALAEARKETARETREWLQEISSSENIMLDTADSYLPGFQVSHAMISDWASMVPEYAAYGKALLVTPKTKDSRSILSSAGEYFQIAGCGEDIVRFLDHIRNGDAEGKGKTDCRKLLFFPSRQTVAGELLDILLQDGK